MKYFFRSISYWQIYTKFTKGSHNPWWGEGTYTCTMDRK